MRFIAKTLIVISILLIGCSKSNNTTETVFTFKANGQAYNWTSTSTTYHSEFVKFQFDSVNNHYILISEMRRDQDTLTWPYVSFGILVPKLEVKTYSGGYKDVMCETGLPDGTANHTNFAPDSSTLTITSIHDGLVDGTFSARMTFFAPSLIITEGVFKNVSLPKE